MKAIKSILNKSSYLLFPIIVLGLYSCSKKEENKLRVPTLSSKTATNITNNTATVGGAIIENGGAFVYERGVCYSTTSIPTITDNTEKAGSGDGTFSCIITELLPSTLYYYRAYAMNSAGVGYGNEQNFLTLQDSLVLPTVITATVTDITETTATCGGDVLNSGGSSVTSRGVCYKTGPSPSINDAHTINGDGTGNFTSNLVGLLPNTKYYVRAYAINNAGTAYGNQESFTTSGGGPPGEPCPGIPTVEYGGQTYNTVQIGNQCWLRENLNYEIGNSYCWLNDPNNCIVYGRLYDWGTAIIACPSGWHLPSDDEWKILEGTVDSQYGVGNSIWDETGWRGDDAGENLKSTYGWHSGGTGSNISGFTALPGEMCGPGGGKGYFEGINKYNQHGHFWTSTADSPQNAWFRILHFMRTDLGRLTDTKENCRSIRCIKD